MSLAVYSTTKLGLEVYLVYMGSTLVGQFLSHAAAVHCMRRLEAKLARGLD